MKTMSQTKRYTEYLILIAEGKSEIIAQISKRPRRSVALQIEDEVEGYALSWPLLKYLIQEYKMVGRASSRPFCSTITQ